MWQETLLTTPDPFLLFGEGLGMRLLWKRDLGTRQHLCCLCALYATYITLVMSITQQWLAAYFELQVVCQKKRNTCSGLHITLLVSLTNNFLPRSYLQFATYWGTEKIDCTKIYSTNLIDLHISMPGVSTVVSILGQSTGTPTKQDIYCRAPNKSGCQTTVLLPDHFGNETRQVHPCQVLFGFGRSLYGNP